MIILLISYAYFSAFQCGLQFLGNLAAGNEESKNIVWKNAFPDLFLSPVTRSICKIHYHLEQSLFLDYFKTTFKRSCTSNHRNYLNHWDKKAVTYCCMVLFTCLSAERTADLVSHTKGVELAETVVKICRTEPELDWAFLIVTDQFLKCPDLVAAMYTKLNNQGRITVLDLISAKLSERRLGSSASSDELNVPERLMQFLAGCFQEKCMAVLKFTSATDAEDEEALIVIRLLDILCETTSNHEKFSYLQNPPGLIETVVELLYQTHLAGKQSRNVFSVSQSLSFTSHNSHPAVGFKAHLIHLIGNLCHNNSENQDKVRELGGIPLILDNCSIDENNPFVSQWAVFTIRILTDQNLQNQEVIAQMAHQGVAESAMLNNMGLQVEERDGKLYVKSQKHSS
uniref:ataxin-10 isoform X2 n=1 Tax=Pristiophorus japonicus TaxID=55135 RepID=UPI00398F2829